MERSSFEILDSVAQHPDNGLGNVPEDIIREAAVNSKNRDLSSPDGWDSVPVFGSGYLDRIHSVSQGWVACPLDEGLVQQFGGSPIICLQWVNEVEREKTTPFRSDYWVELHGTRVLWRGFTPGGRRGSLVGGPFKGGSVANTFFSDDLREVAPADKFGGVAVGWGEF